jgi:hypothetical protein
LNQADQLSSKCDTRVYKHVDRKLIFKFYENFEAFKLESKALTALQKFTWAPRLYFVKVLSDNLDEMCIKQFEFVISYKVLQKELARGYIIIEYCGSNGTLWARNPSITLQQIEQVVRDIAKAITEIPKELGQWGDAKLSNICVDPGTLKVTLIDFESMNDPDAIQISFKKLYKYVDSFQSDYTGCKLLLNALNKRTKIGNISDIEFFIYWTIYIDLAHSAKIAPKAVAVATMVKDEVIKVFTPLLGHDIDLPEICYAVETPSTDQISPMTTSP